MKPKTIYVFTLIIFFNTIIAQNLLYDFFTFDEAVKYINDVSYKKNDYDDMISNLISLLNNHYIYLDIAKNPPRPFKSIDVIKELKSIKTDNIKYYEFYLRVSTILMKLRDIHLQIFFQKVLDVIYVSPIYYYTKTINSRNYLFCNINTMGEVLYDKSLLKKITENKKNPIKSINGKDPFDFVQTFGGYQKFKSKHAQFTYNINQFMHNGRFHTYPFIKKDLTNIKVEFNNGISITFDYKILKPKKMSRKLEEFYNEEMKKYSPYDIIKPTIIEIEQKFIKQNNTMRNLQQSFWDMDYDGKLKLKVDHKNKVNVIYQNSFSFIKYINNKLVPDNYQFFIKMSSTISRNKYPIIIIEDFNGGGAIGNVFYLLNAINPELSLNSLNLANKVVDKNTKYEIDNYGKGIKHKRTKIHKYLFNHIWNKFNKIKGKIRKANEIIVFTDGYAFSATSLFIKNLQESGNAIIVGYNGNPSEKRKHDKFDSSQSPSTINFSFEKDNNVIKLNKYGIKVEGITSGETFSDRYINKKKTPIPREYLIYPIDERSNIYGKYNDNRYNEFVKEGNRIFNKYKKQCNPNNKIMVLYNPSCKFGNTNQIGGYKCSNGRWHNTCQISNCKKPYIFDTYAKRCIKEESNKNIDGGNGLQNEIEM